MQVTTVSPLMLKRIWLRCICSSIFILELKKSLMNIDICQRRIARKVTIKIMMRTTNSLNAARVWMELDSHISSLLILKLIKSTELLFFYDLKFLILTYFSKFFNTFWIYTNVYFHMNLFWICKKWFMQIYDAIKAFSLNRLSHIISYQFCIV